MRRINVEGLAKLKEWEGLVLHAYDDADPKRRKLIPGDPVKGTLTIGYGSTKNVKQGMVITKTQAEGRLTKDLAPFEKGVDQAVKVPLTDNQFAALVSFAYNVGMGAFLGSTLLKKLNAGEYDSVPYQMGKWTKTTINGKKVVSAGLVNRRASEAGLWAKGLPIASNTIEAMPVTKPIVTKESGAMVAGMVGAMGGNLFTGDGPIQWAIAAMGVICFLFGAVWYLKRRA